MSRPTRSGAERYLAQRAESKEFAGHYDDARRRIDQIDDLVHALDERRNTLGLSKAELARRAGIAPEVIRRLFIAASPNPTIAPWRRSQIRWAWRSSLESDEPRSYAVRARSAIASGSSSRTGTKWT